MRDNNKKATSIWQGVEVRWPVPGDKGGVGFAGVKEGMESFLAERGVLPYAFSHFGLIVNDIESSLVALGDLGAAEPEGVKSVWVEAYSVHVARCMVEGLELEFIQPAGKGMFCESLKGAGEGLHHLGFLVKDIQDCLERLDANKVELIDRTPRSGSHGRIAFLSPGLFAQTCIELCEKQK